MVRQQVWIFEILTNFRKTYDCVWSPCYRFDSWMYLSDLLFKLGNATFVEIKPFLLSDNWSWKLFPHDQFQCFTYCEGREEMDIYWNQGNRKLSVPSPLPHFIVNEPGAQGNNQNSGWLHRAPVFKLSVISLHSAAHCVSDSCGLILLWEVCFQPHSPPALRVCSGRWWAESSAPSLTLGSSAAPVGREMLSGGLALVQVG